MTSHSKWFAIDYGDSIAKANVDTYYLENSSNQWFDQLAFIRIDTILAKTLNNDDIQLNEMYIKISHHGVMIFM